MNRKDIVENLMINNAQERSLLHNKIESLEEDWDTLNIEMQEILEKEVENFKIETNKTYNEDEYEDLDFLELFVKAIKAIKIGNVLTYNAGSLTGYITRVNDKLYFDMYSGLNNNYDIESLCVDARDWDVIAGFKLIG